MSYVNNVSGNVETQNVIGTIESILTNGNTTIITANAKIQVNNVVGKLGLGKIDSTDHNTLKNRGLPNQHPINSITGLEEALGNAGKVKDVVVNGNSVLDKDGIAKIENIGSKAEEEYKNKD